MTQAKLSQTRSLVRAFIASAMMLVTTTLAQAQISIGVSGSSGTLTFDTLPLAEEFATAVLGTGGATFLDPAAMDAGAQTVDASTVVGQLTTSGTVPPGTFAAGMRYNTTGLYLQSRPTTGGINGAGVMKVTLVNNSGGDLTQVNISYDYAIFNIVAEEVPGFRVFYSFTGAPGSWTLIPALSGNETPGVHSDNLGAVVWPSGSILYILWADDNDDGASDYGQTIDNMVISGISTIITPITITNDPDSVVVNERSPASFTVEASGSPQGYHWLSNGVPIPGANDATYSIPSAPFSANGAVFSCIVSNSLNSPTSDGATLTVTADTTAPTAVVANASTNGTEVIITFSEAMNPAVADPSSFTVFPTDTDPDATGIPTLSLVVNGSTITLTLGSALTDGVNYSVRIFDVYDTSEGVPGGNLITPYPTIIPVRRNLLLIDLDGPNNEWKYSTETNLFEVDPGWAAAGYDDSGVTWLSGPAALGVNTDANPNSVLIRTATAYAANSAPQFFRRHFFLPASTIGATLSMRHLFEDGGVVFINGQEAARINVGEDVLSAATRATANFAENSPLPAPVPLPTTNLVAGDNVIAVVVIQNGGTSSDSIMALELVAGFDTYAAGPPSIVTQPASQTVDEGANVSFSVNADGALPLAYQWSRNGSPLNGQTNASLNIVEVLPSQAGNYTVLVSNNLGSSNSVAAVLTVNADTTAPVFVSAVGNVNLTNITLTIADAFGLNQSAAETPANYSVTGPDTLTIESAVLINSSNVLLTTSPRTQSQSYTVTISGIVDRSEAANVATPSSRPLLGGIVVLAPDDTTLWRYDNTSNTLDGLGWELPGYNDSGWLTGLAGFANRVEEIMPAGYETRTLTLVPVNTGGSPTIYFRVPFNFPGNPASAQLRLVGVVDDGMVAYVNGVEAGRIRMTNDAPVSFNAFATAASPETTDVHGLNDVLLSTAALVQGNNLLAIQLHQNNLTSSDVAFSIQLVGEIAEFAAVGPTLTISYSGGNVTVTWAGGGTLQHSTDISSSANWSNVPGAPTSPYTTTAADPFRFYRVVLP